MPNLKDFAINMISNNPHVSNNPQAQHMLQIIQNGDSKQGQQIAENICKTYGITPEQAVQQAKKFFGMP